MFHLHANSQAGTIQKCPLLQDKNQRDLINKKNCTEFAELSLTKGRGVLFWIFRGSNDFKQDRFAQHNLFRLQLLGLFWPGRFWSGTLQYVATKYFT